MIYVHLQMAILCIEYLGSVIFFNTNIKLPRIVNVYGSWGIFISGIEDQGVWM